MNTAQALPSTTNYQDNGSTNALARALEAESKKTGGLNAFSEALRNTHSGKQFNMPEGGSEDFSNDYLKQHQEDLRKQQEQDALRKRLHAQVQPTENFQVFHAREEQVKKQIEQLKAQLIPVAKQVEEAQPQVFTPLHSETAEPGLTGTGLLTYFEGLGSRLKEYNKSIKDSGTWLAVGKKKRGLGQGNVTKNVQNTMWHENSNNGGAG